MVETSQSLLGNSQTFIGILVTLVVLCLFHDKTNFFTTFLAHLSQEIQEIFDHKRNTLVNDINDKFWSDAEKADYTFYSSVAQRSPELQQKLYQTTQKAQIEPSNFMQSGNDIIKNEISRLKEIESAKEFGFSSTYIFFFGIVLLFVDSIFPKSGLFCNIFVYIFTLSSYAFLLIIWRQFWLRYKPGYIQTDSSMESKKDSPVKSKKDSPIKPSVIIINKVSFVIIPLLILLCAAWFLKNDELWNIIFYMIFGIIYFVMFFFIQRKHFYSIRNTHKYSRHYIVCHFVWILLASVLVGLLYCFLTYILEPYIEIDNGFYTNFPFYKFIVLFMVLNAIIIPFTVSYFKYYFIKKDILKKMDEIKNQSVNNINNLKSTYNQTIAQIKKSISR